MANEESRKGNDFLREQDEKRNRAMKELQDLQTLLDGASEGVQKKPASAAPKKPAAAPRPQKASSQETVLMEKNLYQQAEEERARQEEAARQERIRRTSSQKKSAAQPKKAQPAAADAPRPVRKVTRAEAERRRKARRRSSLIRLGGLLIVLLLIILAAACTIRKASKSPKDLNAANGSAVVEGSASAENGLTVDTSKPASQQETEQYLAVKDDADAPDYAKTYPGLYADTTSVTTKESEEKVCYLTFDDGPSDTVTPKILNTLEEYDVQATFFLVASQVPGNEELVQRMIEDGDTVCIHANVHEYETIYASVQAYLDDFAAAYDTIYAATGYRVQGFRFPGGSNNGILTGSDTLYSAIVTEMRRRGFEYYDWNAYDGDAEGSSVPDPASLASRAVDEVGQSSRNDVILLMHDTYGKENTATALPSIIEGLRSEGIDMLPISDSTRPVHFEVNEDTPSEYTGQEEDNSEEDSSEEDIGDEALE
ncbi:MAG: polysaccharide deacetylase family protein [Eubacteriales bacterium]|nr:polysaccharide deacetylase family protein [Eubacteriales bacterium]